VVQHQPVKSYSSLKALDHFILTSNIGTNFEPNSLTTSKLKWFSTYLLNTSLKVLDHFILFYTIANKFTVR